MASTWPVVMPINAADPSWLKLLAEIWATSALSSAANWALLKAFSLLMFSNGICAVVNAAT